MALRSANFFHCIVRKSLFFLVFFVGVGTLFVASAQASAVFSLVADHDRYEVGDVIGVRVVLDSEDIAMNALEMNVLYDTQKLSFLDADTHYSLVKLWIGAIEQDAHTGSILMRGGLPHPGYRGESGLITTLFFKVVEPGKSFIRFGDRSRILADDGLGTSIPLSFNSLNLTIDDIVFRGPLITSETHPDNIWGDIEKPIIRLIPPEEKIEGYSYSLSRNPLINPDSVIDIVEEIVNFENLEDGVWYFKVSSYSLSFGWSSVSTHRLLVDHELPSQVSVIFNDDNSLSFFAEDRLSGIDHFEVAFVKDGDVVDRAMLQFKKIDGYLLSGFSHAGTLFVRVYDRAGNMLETSQKISEISRGSLPFFSMYWLVAIIIFFMIFSVWFLSF